jgi:hypothetical protein
MQLLDNTHGESAAKPRAVKAEFKVVAWEDCRGVATLFMVVDQDGYQYGVYPSEREAIVAAAKATEAETARTECFICGKPADEHLGKLSYQPFVAAHDCENVYVHAGCLEPLQAIEEKIAGNAETVP